MSTDELPIGASPVVTFQRLHAAAVVPAYQTEHAAGMDLVAVLAAPVELAPGDRAMIGTGLAVAIPVGYEGQVRPRSGLAARHGVTVVNAPGTIDADYRGELMVLLVNLGRNPFTVRAGERIAQLVIAPVVQARVAVAEALPATRRGSGGFGSTGR